MKNLPSTLIIPVESQVREMDAKLLLSCVAAEKGFPVIMGSRAYVHFKVDSIKRGVYIAKSMRELSIRMFGILRKLGHEIVAWDEEGLVRERDQDYYRWRLSPIAMQQVSHLFAWGSDNAYTLHNYPRYNGAPIHITGNPRIDLLRPELRVYYQPQVEAIRKRLGDFVLVNTNFSKVNHFYANLGALNKAAKTTEDQNVDPYDAGKGRHKLALFQSFTEMLPSLCTAFPNRSVVVRPHPSENHAPYLAIAERCSNLQVINEGSIVPWLMAARVLVANGCMTMVEAAVLDTPTISYQPVVSKEFDDDLPNSLGRRTFSIEELCTVIQSIVQNELGPLDYAVRREILDRHIEALDGPFAAERIADVLTAGKYNQKQPPPVPIGDYVSGWLHTKLRTAAKHINMRRPGHRNNLAFHAHRFPDISIEKVRQKISRFGKLLNRFENIHLEQYSKHIFRISA